MEDEPGETSLKKAMCICQPNHRSRCLVFRTTATKSVWSVGA